MGVLPQRAILLSELGEYKANNHDLLDMDFHSVIHGNPIFNRNILIALFFNGIIA
ncbi:unnamed protein product [marine sediment metagenome]|uniref:Uncharacterized protein n=1 Tax=marine sediment metagenome TaxID=412755 RepID=X1CEV1_9ZZZZ